MPVWDKNHNRHITIWTQFLRHEAQINNERGGGTCFSVCKCCCALLWPIGGWRDNHLLEMSEYNFFSLQFTCENKGHCCNINDKRSGKKRRLFPAPCSKATEAYPWASVLPLDHLVWNYPEIFLKTKGREKKMSKICERETQVCPSSTTVNKGTRLKSAQTQSVKFLYAYLFCSYSPRPWEEL